MHEPKIIAVDFDGTLCYEAWPEIGTAKTDVLDAIKAMQAFGDYIILWTCRTGKLLDEAINWCKDKGLEFDAVNENLPFVIERYGGDNRKIHADLYIDDKSVNPNEVNKVAVDFGNKLAAVRTGRG